LKELRRDLRVTKAKIVVSLKEEKKNADDKSLISLKPLKKPIR
jgi:hypothetical protein